MSLKDAVAPAELQARREVGEQLVQLMSLNAWKHVLRILERIEEQSTQDEDNIPLEDLQHSIALIAEARGKRKAIEKIHRDLDYLVNGMK